MTVNNTTATLNEPLQIYQYDRGITLRIKVLKYKYTFNRVEEEDATHGMFSARAILLPPDGGKAFGCERQAIEDDLVIINIPLEWTDTEVGKYKLQVQLYGRDPEKERVTLPPVEFIVAPAIGYVPEPGVTVPGYVESAYLDMNYLVEAIEEVDDGRLPYGEYNQKIWKPGDIITADELNKSEKAIEYLVRVMPDKVKAVYLPAVSEDGLISWTNDLDLDNPEPVNIMGPQGPQGEIGPQGPQGEAGTSIKILGTVSTVIALQNYANSSEPGDSYLVSATGEVWTFAPSGEFVNLGPIQGPVGPVGPQGEKLSYKDLTEEDKADLTQGFITCNENIKRIEVVKDYPYEEEDGVLYIRVEG